MQEKRVTQDDRQRSRDFKVALFGSRTRLPDAAHEDSAANHGSPSDRRG